MKKALVTGITGQDGTYLTHLLLSKGYQVHGLQRRSSSTNTQRLEYLNDHPCFHNLHLHFGDVTDSTNIIRLLSIIEPDEIYHLAAQSHVAVSFETPEYTANADALGTLRILEALRILGLTTKTKFYQASTSELYGKVHEIPQTELTPFYPRSPYAAAKLYAYWITVNYRQAYDIFACNGILFNHESPLRGETFVTRKITKAVAEIACGIKTTPIMLGNLNAQRDWGYAPEYVFAMWLMLQHDQPEDFVIATGNTYTVKEFARLAFAEIGKEVLWHGTGIHEQGIDAKTGQVLIAVDSGHFRPTEVDILQGDATKAKKLLNWQAQTTVQTLVKIMVAHDLACVQTRTHRLFGVKNIFEALSF